MRALMRDFCESDPDVMTNELLAERVRYLKRTPKGVVQMCEVFDEIRQEGVQEGIEQGDERRLIDDLHSLMERLSLTAQEALDALNVPEAKRSHYLTIL